MNVLLMLRHRLLLLLLRGRHSSHDLDRLASFDTRRARDSQRPPAGTDHLENAARLNATRNNHRHGLLLQLLLRLLLVHSVTRRASARALSSYCEWTSAINAHAKII